MHLGPVPVKVANRLIWSIFPPFYLNRLGVLACLNFSTTATGVDSSGSCALCERPRSSRVTAQPERGCASFQREPRADNEPTWCPIPSDGAAGPGAWV